MPASIFDCGPLLLADLEKVVGVAVVIFWIVAWILKLVASQAQKGPPVATRPKPSARPADDRLQEEIDIFIKEVSPKKPGKRPPPAKPPVPIKTSKPRKPPLKPATLEPTAPANPARTRPGQAIAARHIAGGESLGDGVQQHLQSHMRERVAREAAAHLANQVDESVSRHLGTAAVPTDAGTATKAPRIIDSLRNPATLKQAMVVSLILGPPPARQRRSHAD